MLPPYCSWYDISDRLCRQHFVFLEVMSCFGVLCCHYVSGLLICFTKKSESNALKNPGCHDFGTTWVLTVIVIYLDLCLSSQSRKTRTDQLGNLSLYYSASMPCASQWIHQTLLSYDRESATPYSTKFPVTYWLSLIMKSCILYSNRSSFLYIERCYPVIVYPKRV